MVWPESACGRSNWPAPSQANLYAYGLAEAAEAVTIVSESGEQQCQRREIRPQAYLCPWLVRTLAACIFPCEAYWHWTCCFRDAAWRVERPLLAASNPTCQSHTAPPILALCCTRLRPGRPHQISPRQARYFLRLRDRIASRMKRPKKRHPDEASTTAYMLGLCSGQTCVTQFSLQGGKTRWQTSKACGPKETPY